MAELPETKTLLLDAEPGWLTIWLNRPESRNALSPEMVAELQSVLEAIAFDRAFRGVTLRGRGGTFCAGGDIKGFSAMLAGEVSRQEVEDISKVAGALFHRFNEYPKVTIALVEGAATAGGLGLAAAADFVIATEDAKFALTETALGIVPAQIAPLIVERIGTATARRIMLTAARLDAEAAQKLGLADQIVPNGAAFDAAEKAIRAEVIRCAPDANALTKSLVLQTLFLPGSSMIDFAAERFATAMLGDEAKEGISAFVEKRKPKWAE
ncbi:MAG TPA: enoyl-CoA hydratase-related protein [Rhizobiaceae bacterium]|nr:enoyl-CoA hydratase-related protein [Rhizobiaceae bacterium]